MNLDAPLKSAPHLRWRKLGPVGTAAVMVLPVIFFAWLNRYVWTAVASGSLFSEFFDRYHPGHNVGAIKAGLFVFSLLALVSVCCISFGRYISDKDNRLSRLVVAVTAVFICVCALGQLVSPSLMLVHYIRSYGITVMRVLGMFYVCGGLCGLTIFLAWAVKSSPNERNA